MLVTHDERRVFQRMAIEADVIIQKGGVQYRGICNDFSSTGMAIKIESAFLQADDIIDLELDTANSRFPPLKAEAKVIRIRDEDGTLVAAVEFTVVK